MHDRLPPFRGIEAFLYLVETGGIRATARAMNLSISAVSNRLRLLEAKVGVPLYRRGPRRLELTAPARKFHEDLQPIVRDLAAAAGRLARHTESATVSVSASNSIISSWLGGRLGDWRKRYPGVHLDIHSLESTNGQLETDIVIRSIYNTDPGPDQLQLFKWEMTPVCKLKVVQEYDLREPADLDNVPLLDVYRSAGGWNCWLEAAGLPLDYGDRSLIFDTADLMVDGAALGLGVAIGAVAMSQEYRDRDLVMPFKVTCVMPGGAYVNAPAPHERPVVTTFRNWLLEIANDSVVTEQLRRNVP